MYKRYAEKWSPEKMVPGKMVHGKMVPAENGHRKNGPRKKWSLENWSPEKFPSKIVLRQKNTRKGYSRIRMWKLPLAEICLNVYQMVACDQKLMYAKLQPPKSHFKDVRENKEFFMHDFSRFSCLRSGA